MTQGKNNQQPVFCPPFTEHQKRKYCKSGADAIADLASVVVKKSGIVLLPAFIPAAVLEPFLKAGWKYRFYDIKIDLTPDIDDLNRKIGAFSPDILWVQDYFGFDTLSDMDEQLQLIREKGPVMIMDISHSLLSGFQRIKSDYCLADFGMWATPTTGGFIQSAGGCGETDIKPMPEADEFDPSDDLYDMMHASGERMDKWDIETISQRRRENYRCLYQGLKDNPLFHQVFPECPDDVIPLYFPLYVKKERIRAMLQQYLAGCKIDCPVIWPELPLSGGQHTQGEYIYQHLLAIPCAPQFDCRDMQRIVDCTNGFSYADDCPDVYYMQNWGKANAQRDGGEYACFKFEGANGSVVYPYVKRKINTQVDGCQYYDTLTPYGFNGPVVIRSIDKTALLSEFDRSFSEHCQSENIVAEYIRFSPWLKNHADFMDFYHLKYRTKTVYIDLSGDFFNAEFSSSLRNKIRKAQKNKIEIRFDFDDQKVSEFLTLFNNMLRKQGAGAFYEYSESFIRNLFSELKNNIFQASAIYEGKYVSAALFLFDETYIHYHLCGNDYEYTNLAGNPLLLYEVAKWAKNRNIKVFHQGGAYHESLFKYKMEFTRNGLLDFYVGTKIRNQEIYDRLIEVCGENESGFFPAYR